jgi:hypothetical protein
MNNTRNSASTTLLSSGKVLVTGGFSFMDVFTQSSAGLFDLVAMNWNKTGAMFTFRAPCGRSAAQRQDPCRWWRGRLLAYADNIFKRREL